MANNDDSAKYWEAQASMWHEKYRDALRHEDDAKRYRDALLRIKDGYGITKERLRFIVTRALEPVGALIQPTNQPTEQQNEHQ